MRELLGGKGKIRLLDCSAEYAPPATFNPFLIIPLIINNYEVIM
jgi:hypothetical protein